jgi:acetylornithine deacetylase/succinyl-diaminopimelate desuccinylase-like protein
MMADPRTPALTVGFRGLLQADITLRTAARSLHSGLYGGVVINAYHALHRMLAPLLGPALPPVLSRGACAPSDDEQASWRGLPDGSTLIRDAGALPADDRAAREFHERTGASATLDVAFVAAGEPRTLIPATASALVNLRLAPGQDGHEIERALVAILESGVPEGATLELRVRHADGVMLDHAAPAVQLARPVLERVFGRPPVLVRTGLTVPVVAEMAAQGMQVVAVGFGLPDDAIHAANESFGLHRLSLAHQASRELLEALPRALR